MARKRYETAFLPSSSSTSDDNLQSPDADFLLLAIEGTSLTDPHNQIQNQIQSQRERENGSQCYHQSLTMKNQRHMYKENGDDRDPSILSSHTPQDSISNSGSNSPSPYQFQFQEVHVHHHNHHQRWYSCNSSSSSSSPNRHSSYREEIRGNFNKKEESQSNSLCSPRKLVNPNQNLSLSEPLPMKRYSSVSSSRSSSHVHGPIDKIMLTKDNSISSLESLDSTKSDDLQLLRHHFTFSRPAVGGQGGGGQNNSGGPYGKIIKSKLLSPISDKSPLEPKSLNQLQSIGIDFNREVGNSSRITGDDIHSSTTGKPRGDPVVSSTLDAWDWSNKNVLSAAELTNVPWEMPKLRRKLALMADSGISLDLPPPPAPILAINPIIEVSNFTSRNKTTSSNLFSHPTGAQFTDDGDLTSASTSKIANPPLATCQNLKKKPEEFTCSHQSITGGSSGSGNTETRTSNSNDSSQWGKRGNLDLKLPLRTGRAEGNYLGEDYYGNANDVHENYLPSSNKLDRYKIWLDFNGGKNPVKIQFDPKIELESQDWFYGAITRSEAEDVLRPTKEGSFLVRNCESSNFNQYSLSLKCARGFIHIRIEPNSLGTFSLGDQQFPSVPQLVLHFMTHRLPIKGAEHVKLIYPVINQLL